MWTVCLQTIWSSKYGHLWNNLFPNTLEACIVGRILYTDRERKMVLLDFVTNTDSKFGEQRSEKSVRV
jgi:hypothetical protein